MGILSSKELKAREYRNALKKKYGADAGPAGKGIGEVGQIAKQRHIPKAIKSAQGLKNTMVAAQKTKEDRRRKHTKRGNVKPVAERKAAILQRRED